jgi:hypothetical protein
MSKKLIYLVLVLSFCLAGTLTAGELIKINFQLAGADVPEGYLPDTGLVFGDRGNGYSYGWSQDMTGQTRDRNNAAAADQRYDTLIHFMGTGAVWEIELPPGFYRVFIVCGDPSNADSTNAIELEGELLADDPDGEDSFDEFEFIVNVSDGRLTWSEPQDSYVKPCFIEIESSKPIVRAVKPDPEDGSMLTDTWVNLGWKPGEFAVSHDVYLGDNFDDVNAGVEGTFQGNLATTNLIVGFPEFPYPDGLVPGTTYYWRIDEVNDADPNSPWKGDVWSFLVPPKKAYEPNPPDGAKFVDLNVELRWTAGFGTKLHYVYFGDNFDDVNEGVVGLPHTTTTYTPGTLAKDAVYYWRVDEFDGAATHKGDVWSFKTVPDIPITDPNLFCWWKFDVGSGTTAIDWSGHDNHGTIQGDPQWVAGQVGGALDFGGDGDHVIDDDAGSAMNGLSALTVALWIKSDVVGTDSGFIIFENPQGRDTRNIRYDQDMGDGRLNGIKYGTCVNPGDTDDEEDESPINLQTTEWQHIAVTWASGAGDFPVGLNLYINGVLQTPSTDEPGAEGVLTGYERVMVGKGAKDEDADAGWDGLIDDVRIYNKVLTAEDIKEVMRGEPELAWNPNPANGSTPYIREATPLSWSPGDFASQHDVYFGTDRDTVADANASDTTGIYRGRQGITIYTPAEGVEWGAGPYYWRIDEYNTDATISKGRIWSFTVADHIVIEDFEDYNDYEPDRIFETWIDGWGVEANGYAEPNFPAGEHHVETTIVHGGSQSMPYFYENNFKYSEATLTLVSARDWTEEGVGVLSLWFYGDASNTAERMYVALNGIAKVYHGNPDAALIEDWTEWTIDLQEFAAQGVNLTNVNTISIGFGDKNNLQAGGSGLVFFDDIRLYRPAPEPEPAP